MRGHTTWTMGEDRGPEIRLDLESVTQVDLLVGLTCVTPRGPQHILRIHSPNTGVFRHHPHTYALVRQIGAFDAIPREHRK